MCFEGGGRIVLVAGGTDLVEERLGFEEVWASRPKEFVGWGPVVGMVDALEAQMKVAVAVVDAVDFVQPRKRVRARCGEVEGDSLVGRTAVEGMVVLCKLS
jgi:hypothetical protein